MTEGASPCGTVYYFRHGHGTLQKSTFRTCQTGRLGPRQSHDCGREAEERNQAVQGPHRRRRLRKPRPGNKNQEREGKRPALCQLSVPARPTRALRPGHQLRAILEKSSPRAGGNGRMRGGVWTEQGDQRGAYRALREVLANFDRGKDQANRDHKGERPCRSWQGSFRCRRKPVVNASTVKLVQLLTTVTRSGFTSRDCACVSPAQRDRTGQFQAAQACQVPG